MLIVTAADGAVFQGNNAHDVVRQMKSTDWNAPERKGEYMEDVSRRLEMVAGSPVRTGSPKTFLKDLESLGLVTINEADAPPAATEGSGSAQSPS